MHSLINDKSHFDRHLHKLSARLHLWQENLIRLARSGRADPHARSGSRRNTGRGDSPSAKAENFFVS